MDDQEIPLSDREQVNELAGFQVMKLSGQARMKKLTRLLAKSVTCLQTTVADKPEVVRLDSMQRIPGTGPRCCLHVESIASFQKIGHG